MVKRKMNENVMEHMDGLGLSVSDRFTCLRKRLDDVGCVFEFVIMPVKEGASIDEQCHRLALAKLYEQVMFSQMEWFRRLIQSLSVADYPEPTMRWNLAEAFAEQMTQQQILSLLRVDADQHKTPSLYTDFSRSPCLSRQIDSSRMSEALFAEWTDALGLRVQDDPVVLNWADAPSQGSSKPAQRKLRCAWTDFFCPTPFGQHRWCLTIWNPARRTLAAVAACSTVQS